MLAQIFYWNVFFMKMAEFDVEILYKNTEIPLSTLNIDRIKVIIKNYNVESNIKYISYFKIDYDV